MKLKCPNNDNHEYFSVTAHVTQDWAVDKNGDFVEVRDDCMDVTHRPNQQDCFMCEECGELAQVYDDSGNLIRR